MKKIFYYSIASFILTVIVASCGSSKKAEAEKRAEQKNAENKQKMEQLDRDKKKFELQNKELK